MPDIADIGFRADTSGLKDAKASLDALPPSADKAERSSNKLSATLAKVDATADKLAAAASGLSSVVDKMNSVLDRSGKTAATTAAAHGNLSVSANKVAVTFNGVASAANGATSAVSGVAGAAASAAAGLNSQGAATSRAASEMDQLDAHVTAYRANLRQLKIDQMAAGQAMGQMDAHMVAYRDHLDKSGASAKAMGQAIKFSAIDGLQASRQLADIAVTGFSGMSPFMIALQQGPQLFDILQNKAVMTGQTIGAVFRAAGVAIWTALAPLLPIIALIALAVGGIAAAFGLATREISKGNENIAKGLGLTEKQLERVKKAGVDTGVTMGDTFTAFFQVIESRLAAAFAEPIKAVKKEWNGLLDDTTSSGRMAIKDIVGTFVGGYFAIVALWKKLPTTFEGIGALVANGFIAIFENMINRIIRSMNDLNGRVNEAANLLGLGDIIPKLQDVTFGRIANKQAEATANAVAEGYQEGYKAAGAATDRFFADVGKKARANRAKLIKEAAGDAEKAAKTPKGPKTDAQKFEDIVTGANNDIAAQKAREAAAGITMTAEAATALEYRTKLLNETQSKGIKLTDAMRTKIDELAGAYAKAKTAADNAVGLRDVLKGADADIAGIKAQADMVGLYGRQLAYATQMAKLLNDARSKGMTPEAIAAARPQFENSANQFADASASLANSQFMEEQRRAAQERKIALDQERASIGLSADEANRLRIENELLAQARQKNIDLTPADIAALQGIAAEQAATENAIRRTREALDFAKGAVKGFFGDIRSGLEQGKTLWQSFGDAIIGTLNRILDRLLDNLLNSAIDNFFTAMSGPTGGGGFFGALLSNLTGTAAIAGGGSSAGSKTTNVKKFAKGGAFDGGVVDRTVSFAMGQMGESGPEGILPLSRGPDGSLGVEMHGGMQSAPPSITVDARSYYTVADGAVEQGAIFAAIREAGEQNENKLKRQLPEYLNQIQRDGAIV